MKIDKEKLIQLKREGKSDSECAEVFDCSQSSVSAMCRKLRAEGRLTPATISNAEDYIAEKQLQSAPEGEPKTGKTVAEYLAEEAEEEAALTTDAEICCKPVEPVQDAHYPIPPIDRKTFWECRRDDLRRAICEYACEGLRIDSEWVEEYNELIGRCGG